MIEKLYYTADEIAQMVGVGRTTSYKMVNQMNAELLKQGFLVVKGKIPKEYFDESIMVDHIQWRWERNGK